MKNGLSWFILNRGCGGCHADWFMERLIEQSINQWLNDSMTQWLDQLIDNWYVDEQGLRD